MVTSALMLSLAVAVPLMERTDRTTGPSVEVEHDPSECPVLHDHTVCTQVEANRAHASAGRTALRASVVSGFRLPLEAVQSSVGSARDEHHSRAPPAI